MVVISFPSMSATGKCGEVDEHGGGGVASDLPVRTSVLATHTHLLGSACCGSRLEQILETARCESALRAVRAASGRSRAIAKIGAARAVASAANGYRDAVELPVIR